MFDGFFDKLHSLQENITTTLRGISVTDSSNKKQGTRLNNTVNLNAGVELLEKFQASWSELHNSAQENVKKADEADELIFSIHKRVDKQWKDVSQLTNMLHSLPEVIHSLNELHGKITVLEELFESVEKTLIHFEDILETKEFQNKQLEQRFQLALYKEKKLMALDSVKISLADELSEKIKKHELRQQRLSKECQEASEENFKKDLEIYKKTEKVPKIEFAKFANSGAEENENNSLENITLDSEDPGALEEFLNDSNHSGKENEKKIDN